MSYRRARLVYAAALIAAVAACSGPVDPDDSLDQYGDVSTTITDEPVSFTKTPYDFTGETSIDDLKRLIGSGNTWYGASAESPYPVGPVCDRFGATVETVPELPVEIEGIVTLHPRYFFKPAYCGSDERYYGAYFIEDASGGIMVYKDSRVADFTFGDRVRLTVHGLSKFFDTTAINVFTDETVVSRGGEVYYQDLGSEGLDLEHVGETVRIRGEVVVPPTNYNFNQLCMVPEGSNPEGCDPRCIADGQQCQLEHMLVSIDREIGTRKPIPIEPGQILEITGPVINSFGLQVVVLRLGQINFVEE